MFRVLESLPPAEEPISLITMNTIGALFQYGSTKRGIPLVIHHATRYIRALAHKKNTPDSYFACLKRILIMKDPK